MDFFNAVLIVYTIFIYNNEKRLLQTQAVVQESWRYYFTFSHLHFTVHSAVQFSVFLFFTDDRYKNTIYYSVIHLYYT